MPPNATIQHNTSDGHVVRKLYGVATGKLSNGEEICLPYQGAIWNDLLLNQHLTINIHLLSGATKQNTDLKVDKGGWRLLLTTTVVDLILDPYVFIQFPDLRNGNYHPYHPMVLAFQEEKKLRCKSLQKKQVLETEMAIDLPFQVDEIFCNNMGYCGEIILREDDTAVYHVQLSKKERTNYGFISPQVAECSYTPDRSQNVNNFYPNMKQQQRDAEARKREELERVKEAAAVAAKKEEELRRVELEKELARQKKEFEAQLAQKQMELEKAAWREQEYQKWGKEQEKIIEKRASQLKEQYEEKFLRQKQVLNSEMETREKEHQDWAAAKQTEIDRLKAEHQNIVEGKACQLKEEYDAKVLHQQQELKLEIEKKEKEYQVWATSKQAKIDGLNAEKEDVIKQRASELKEMKEEYDKKFSHQKQELQAEMEKRESEYRVWETAKQAEINAKQAEIDALNAEHSQRRRKMPRTT